MQASDSSADAAPVFLVAAERSGTTLLRLMLDGHPRIAWQVEFNYALEWPPCEAGAWPSREAFWELLRGNRQALQAGVEIDESLIFPDLVRSLLEQLRRRSSKPLFGVTVHRGYDRLIALWPDARFVHLLRDGRAVARSAVEMGWAGNAWSGARAWREAEQAWQRVAPTLPESRRLEVRYEDLVGNPARELTRICAFLGAAYDARMLSYPERSTYRAPRPELAHAWRTKLSRRDWAVLDAELGSLLRAHGYAPGPVPAARISALARLRLRIEDRVGRARAAIRTYGLWLWLARLLSNRVSTHAWRRSVNARLRAIDISLLK